MPPVASLPAYSCGFQLPVTPTGWGTIVADPPWPFQDRGSRATPTYGFMTEDDIELLPVRRIRAPSAHLYLWVPDTHLALGLRVVASWGFDYKHLVVWSKRGATGKTQIGMGHYFRKAHEVCLFATSGKAPARVHNLPSIFEAPRTRHSAKPEQLQDAAELLSPGPYLELFARRHRPGWTCAGIEVNATNSGGPST